MSLRNTRVSTPAVCWHPEAGVTFPNVQSARPRTMCAGRRGAGRGAEGGGGRANAASLPGLKMGPMLRFLAPHVASSILLPFLFMTGKVQFNIWVEPVLRDAIKVRAAQERCSAGELVRRAVEAYAPEEQAALEERLRRLETLVTRY